ncbi:MAG: glucosidase [Ginsengibacter sp.]
MTTEHSRINDLQNNAVPTPEWGPYLSERQWGTVREDYSSSGNAWQYFPFDHAHARAYHWGEDGIAGISDRFQNLCFSVAMWNGKDPILKERLFGLRNGEGNHGEDVKELYYYLDNVPSHFYMEYLYKYPQRAFPYQKLRDINHRLSRQLPEHEILDTGIFDKNKYFDVLVTYAKYSATDIVIKIDVTNRYFRAADITVLPTLWFSKQSEFNDASAKPIITYLNDGCVTASHETIGDYYFYTNQPDDRLFTDNKTNFLKITGQENADIFTKDAFHDAVINGEHANAYRERKMGTKFSPVHKLRVPGGATKTVFCRLTNYYTNHAFENGFDKVFSERKKEADEFYDSIIPRGIDSDLANIQRQAFAGLLWSKQFYCLDIEKWIRGTDGISPVDSSRLLGRNYDWQHLKNQDIVSMPDKWEYPWYAAWDLAFQCISIAAIDPGFAKYQLLLIMREWYMKPDGQLPAYEWNFSDVNPPVHAWASLQVYNIEKKNTGNGDLIFLKKIFHKLLINFTWWINRKDRNGNNIFEGGFLGLDNIGVFNRSFHDSTMQLEQADGTSWMGAYALNMMDIAMEIAMHDESYEDAATKFFEHFVLISESLNEHHLWNKEDKFFYDVLSIPGEEPISLRIKSIVGLTSLFAVSTISRKTMQKLGDFKSRSTWFENYRKSNNKFWPNEERGDGEEVLISLVRKDRLRFLLERLLDENEFLSEGGVRALSKYHLDHPYSVYVAGNEYSITYDPGDSTSDIFGGNSNWRGPVWLPINYLIIQSIRRFGNFYGNDFTVEYPIGSGLQINLNEVADELTRRILTLFVRDDKNERKIYNSYNTFYSQKGNDHLIQFYEYFHGDSGKGLGASHQTGWTSLIAELITEYTARQKKEITTAVLSNELQPS